MKTTIFLAILSTSSVLASWGRAAEPEVSLDNRSGQRIAGERYLPSASETIERSEDHRSEERERNENHELEIPLRTHWVDALSETDVARLEKDLQTLRSLQEGHTDRTDEAKIIFLFQQAPPGEFNQLLLRSDLHELLEDLDDRWIGPQNKTLFLDLLTSKRFGDLTVESRAHLVQALQKGRTDSQEEGAILQVFLGSHGKQLAELKHTLDDSGSYRDLHQLVFRDIDDTSLRETLLRHLAQEAGESTGLKVLSDIDDTLYVNWKDRRFPKKTVYPGIVQFYQELLQGTGLQSNPPGGLTFITARPNDRTGIVEMETRLLLERLTGIRATVLTGSITSLTSDTDIAVQKLQNFLQYRQVYPEYRFVWIGDSGQGDVQLARAMFREAPDAVLAAFIHDVSGLPPEEWARAYDEGIYYCNTYVGAAVDARLLGLMGEEGLSRVALAAREDFRRIVWPTPALREARWEELLHDLQRANELLQADKQIALD